MRVNVYALVTASSPAGNDEVLPMALYSVKPTYEDALAHFREIFGRDPVSVEHEQGPTGNPVWYLDRSATATTTIGQYTIEAVEVLDD